MVQEGGRGRVGFECLCSKDVLRGWYDLIYMGNCMGSGSHPRLPKEAMYQIRQILSDEEIYILHLMYRDLAERIVDRKINMENFLLFFHKNGFWGDRLFREFDYDETNLISEEEFIRGIAKIFKSTEKEKISLLFKFFSKNGQKLEGVFFNEFLTMLYNYPKEDLKEILNDKDFIEFQLKKHLVPIDNMKKSDHFDTGRIESVTNIKHIAMGYSSEKVLEKKGTFYKLDDHREEAALHSMIGKDIMRSIKEKYKPKETVIRLKDGDNNFYDIKTINIQQLVKKFALRIFHQAKIDEKYGKLNFEQFYSWISVHKALYENYYDGFHNLVWEIDPITLNPRYLTSPHEKTSDAKTLFEESLTKVKLYLQHSILVVCQEKRLEKPIMIVCLEGLAVRRIYDMENGFGIEISHRDGIYVEKKIYFKNEGLLLEWMELLKFYKGDSVQQRYQIGEKIGTGKFSVVYKCRSVADHKDYALKEIATFKLDPQARNLIAHESSIMQIVSHPLLLEFKECLQTKTHIYIITQLVNGKDLFEFVKDYQFLDEYDAAKITQQIIVGIRFLHSFEIVHRDLKPENIMVVIDEESQEVSNIKIIDFGFSNYLSKLHEKTGDELLAGTPNYIAPEVLREEEIGFKIDNFALGVILYFMLTGMLPFNDYTITDILKNTMAGQYKFSDKRTLSAEAMDLVDKLLQNDPNNRISLEDAVKHPWFAILKEPRKKERRAAVRDKTKKFQFLE